jgi:hypothetical protein
MGHVWAELTDYSTGFVSAPTFAFVGSDPIAISTIVPLLFSLMLSMHADN